VTARIRKVDGELILYDDALVDQARPELFSPNYWRWQNALRATLSGRGATWVVGSARGDWVLRPYRRGGLVGRMIKRHYLWTGLQHTRPWREWHVLAALGERDLPVPRPVAACIARHGFVYTGAILTELIDNATTLARRMRELGIGAINWARVGTCLRRFHAAGVDHADLNAHNILLTPGDEVYLIDFDRGCLREEGTWRAANLKRLKRSLYKAAGYNHAMVDRAAWPDLMAAYEVADAPRPVAREDAEVRSLHDE
jgi:3-deoxy-D-manno-octulosonic acid kinase